MSNCTRGDAWRACHARRRSLPAALLTMMVLPLLGTAALAHAVAEGDKGYIQ